MCFNSKGRDEKAPDVSIRTKTPDAYSFEPVRMGYPQQSLETKSEDDRSKMKSCGTRVTFMLAAWPGSLDPKRFRSEL